MLSASDRKAAQFGPTVQPSTFPSLCCHIPHMNIRIVKAWNTPSRTLNARLEDYRPQFAEVDAGVSRRIETARILADVPFETLYIYLDGVSLPNPAGELVPGYLRRPTWKFDVAAKEYIARCELNIASWEYQHQKTHLRSTIPVQEMAAQIATSALGVVAQVALEFGRSREDIQRLVEEYNVNLTAIHRAHEAWAS